ncbi:MAG: ribosome-associated translation inhibitor RaiA [Candidatus Omnitrophica bacterium]|nr:ribosome-associated translation inhibitor RaiA [Candidatus Omnitrophota bacterium]
MKVPLQMSFRKVRRDAEIEKLIREKAAKLEEVCDHISSCRVAVENTQKSQERGCPFRVRLDITVPPGHEIVVKREESQGDLHETLPMEIREVFKAAGIKLRKLVDKQHGKNKKNSRKQ